MIRSLLELPAVDGDTIGPLERELVLETWPGGKVVAAARYLRAALPQNPRVPLDRVIVPPNWIASGPRASRSGIAPDLQDAQIPAYRLSNHARTRVVRRADLL